MAIYEQLALQGGARDYGGGLLLQEVYRRSTRGLQEVYRRSTGGL